MQSLGLALASRVAGTILQLTLMAVLNHTLGVEELGRFYVYLGTATFLAYLLTFGVPDFMLRLAGERIWPTGHLVISGTVVTSLIGVLIFPLLVPTFSLVARQLGLADPFPFAAAASSGTVGVMVARPLVETLKGLGRAELAFLAEFVLPSAATLSAAIWLGMSGVGPTWCLPAAHGVGALAGPLALLVRLRVRAQHREQAGVPLPRTALDAHAVQLIRQLRARMAEVGHFWLIQVLGASLAFIPYLVGPFLVTSEALGAFATCDRLTGITSTLGSVLHAVYASQIMSKSTNTHTLVSLYAKSALTYGVLSGLLLVIFVAQPALVLSTLGVDEPHAVSALAILAVGRIIAAMLGIAEVFNKLLGSARQQVRLLILAFVFRILMSVTLGLLTGLVGLALAVSLSAVAYAVSGLLCFWRLAAGRSSRP